MIIYDPASWHDHSRNVSKMLRMSQKVSYLSFHARVLKYERYFKKRFQPIVPATHYYNTHSLHYWLGLGWPGLVCPFPGYSSSSPVARHSYGRYNGLSNFGPTTTTTEEHARAGARERGRSQTTLTRHGR